MPLLRSLGTDAKAIVNKLEPDDAHIWLAKVDVSASEDIYLAANTADVTFLSQTWQAFPFAVGDYTIEGGGEESRLTIQVSDPRRHFRAILKKHDWITGREVELYYVNTGLLGTPTDGSGDRNYIYDIFTVDNASSDGENIVLELSSKQLMTIPAPGPRLYRNMCYKKYKGTEDGGCKYAGALATCDKTYDGPNGCRAHSNQDRYGGAPGFPRAT